MLPAGFLEALDVNHRIQVVPFTMWALDFKQFSLRHAIRVSAGVSIDGFSDPRLSGHAPFPLDFRRQVGCGVGGQRGGQRLLFQPPLPEPDLQLSPHPALQCLDNLGKVGIRALHSPSLPYRSSPPAALRLVVGFPHRRLLRRLRCHRALAP